MLRDDRSQISKQIDKHSSHIYNFIDHFIDSV